MKVKNTIVIVQLSNKKFHQVLLTKRQESLVLGLVMQFEETLKVSEEYLSLELKKPKYKQECSMCGAGMDDIQNVCNYCSGKFPTLQSIKLKRK